MAEERVHACHQQESGPSVCSSFKAISRGLLCVAGPFALLASPQILAVCLQAEV